MMSNDEIVKDLNSKILNMTLTIMDKYPELSKYLDEMPVTIPNTENPEIRISNLKNYFESLNALMNKYKNEHPNID